MKNFKMDKKKKIIALIAVFLIAVVIGLIIAFFAGKGQRSHVVFKGDSSKVNLKQDREDTYSIGVSTSIADNHPYSHDDEAAVVLKKLVYEPLINIDGNYKITYCNAKSITFNKEGREAVVKLNTDKTYSDGEKVKASNVAQSYKWFRSQDNSYKDLLTRISSVKVTDDETLVFTFNTVDSRNITIFNIPIIYQSLKENDYPLGTGKYVIDSVKSTTTEAVLLYDGKTTGYAEYTDAKVGGNIVYEVLANDPSIKEIKANSVKGSTVDSTALPFKDSKYENDVAFDNAETPAIKDYYVRVPDVDADSIQFNVTLTNPDTTTITASDGTTLTPTKNGDGTYTIKAPLTNKGQTENTITITTKAGTDNDAPTLTYTFHVKQLVEAKITLNYGNSPYGEIMKDSAITDKAKAKEEFDKSNKYATGYIPANAASKQNVSYPFRAWVDVKDLDGITAAEQAKLVDPDINIDRNDYAIFIYNGRTFVDPGFTATDSEGKPVTNLTRKITVSRMQVQQIAGLYDVNQKEEPITIPDKPSNYTITEITKKYNYQDPSSFRIRPDVYTMEYSFNDPNQGTITVERKVVVLQDRGDTYCADLINDSSVNPVYVYLKNSSTFDAITGTAHNIYLYRILDTDASNLINDSDANPVYTYLKNYANDKSNPKNPIATLYVELPSGN
jgi:uncharacterized protein YxjI